MSLLTWLGAAAARRSKLVIVVWLIAAIGAVALAAQSGSRFTDRLDIPGTDSQVANDLLQSKFPLFQGTAVQIVFRAKSGAVRDPAAAAGMEATLAEIARQPFVVRVNDPLQSGTGTVSADGTIAYATILYSVQAGELGQPALDRLQTAASHARSAGLQVEFGGELLDFASPLAGSAGEGVGLLAALVILVLAFGSIVAAGLPVATAMVALAVALSAVTVLATRVDITTVAPVVGAMLGLGAGIDYALFISNRFREQLRAGQDVVESTSHALATSGRAVVFAGSTVMASILALWLSGLPIVGWLGTAAAITVGVTVLAAVTLLPALLGLIGHRIERLHVPVLARGGSSTGRGALGNRGWRAWGRHVVARPWPYLLASVAVLIFLAVPVLTLRLGQPDQGSESVATTQRRAYDLLAHGFGPGINGPLLVVVGLPSNGPTDVLNRIESRVASEPDVLAVSPPQTNTAGDTAVITVMPSTAPQAVATRRLLDRLRDEDLPAATSGSGATTHITGTTATYIDLDTKVERALPIVIGGVIALAFVLLVLAFRSIVVAATAAVLNLLSIGTAYGVVVAVFQWGWGLSLVGLDEAVPIVSFVPMFMFAILFGLSMDYEVFLLSRIREQYVSGADTRAAVVGGIGSTARVITSAALIMIAVFLSFVPVAIPSVKMLGVGLATAVAVDATIVRVILLPSAMAILDRANWWIPRWLDRGLPSLAVEKGAARPHD